MVDQVRLDQHPASGLEGRANADVDRRGDPVRERGVDAVAGVGVVLGRDDVRGREAERAPAPVALDDRRPRAGTAPRGSASRPRRRRRRRAPGFGSTRRSRRRPRPAASTLVSNSEWERSISRVPLRLLPEPEVLAHRDAVAPSVSIRIREQNSSASIPRNSLIERDDHQLRDAEALDHVALDLERHDQLRRRLRVDDAQRVRFEGEHGVGALDHLAMADVNAIEGADRDPARARLGLAAEG